MKHILVVIILFFLPLISFAYIVDIAGIVLDPQGNPVENALVRLDASNMEKRTASDGSFQFSTSVNSNPKKFSNPVHFNFSVTGQRLHISLKSSKTINIYSFDLSGNLIGSVSQTLSSGLHNLTLPYPAKGITIYRLTIGGENFSFKLPINGSYSYKKPEQATPLSNVMLQKSLADTGIFMDTLIVSHHRYITYYQPQPVIANTLETISLVQCADTVYDFDGNMYQAVQIGDQIWTATNFRCTSNSNGQPIAQLTKNANEDNDTNTISFNTWVSYNRPAYASYDYKQINPLYGLHYNKNSVYSDALAPEGWHIPSREEWDTLISFLDIEKRGNVKDICSKIYWKCFQTPNSNIPGKEQNKNNKTGLGLVPNGWYRFNDFNSRQGTGWYWSKPNTNFNKYNPPSCSSGFFKIECYLTGIYYTNPFAILNDGNVCFTDEENPACGIRLIKD